MFAAVLSLVGASGGDAAGLQRVGASRQVALLASAAPLPSADEWQGVAQLGERFWIVGRIRLDRRRALAAKLSARRGEASLSDGDLCLLAYEKWGEAFLDHLAGDFCFALWDETRGTLLAARDQLGVRSLFHAETATHRLVSDSLDWLAAQNGIERALDDQWIADFLAIGRSLDFVSTIYRGVKRLPPAHRLVLSRKVSRLQRYWRLEVPEPLYLRDRRDYAERFREVMAVAVADRLPANGRIGVAMSGGLDSTTLAALAVALTGDPSRVVAVCDCFERLMDDPEPHFAGLVARHLGIELRLSPRDDEVYDPEWRSRGYTTSEPSVEVLTAHFDRAARQRMAAEAPVWLFGEGPDNALVFDRDPYFSWLVQRREWRRLAAAALSYLLAKGVGGWGQTMRRYTGSPEAPDPAQEVPAWLEPDFAGRMRIGERLRAAGDIVDRSHSWHPRATGSFANPIWQALFRDLELDLDRAGMVWRLPFLDLEMLQFMISVPPVPWARGKLLIRQAMRGRLPAAVLARPKSPVPVLPDNAVVGDGLGALARSGRLDGYVDAGRVPARLPRGGDPRALVAVHVLDRWMMYDRGN